MRVQDSRFRVYGRELRGVGIGSAVAREVDNFQEFDDCHTCECKSHVRILGSGLRVWGLGFRVPGFGFRVPGFGFQVSGSDLFLGV